MHTLQLYWCLLLHTSLLPALTAFPQYVFTGCTTLFTHKKQSQFPYLHKNPVSPHPCDTQLSSNQSSPWQHHCNTGWNITQLFLTLSYRKANSEMSLALRRSHGADWEQSQSADQLLPLTHVRAQCASSRKVPWHLPLSKVLHSQMLGLGPCDELATLGARGETLPLARTQL